MEEVENDQMDYYEKFHLDYGTKDLERTPGFLRGFIKKGSLADMPEKDSFIKWMNGFLEKGDLEFKERLRPFHGADFGTKKDLKKGENPKVIIVQRKLQTDESGVLLPAPEEVDVEIREIWQPWLKPRCNFVVRYIIPDRKNIIRILGKNRQFFAKLKCEDDAEGRRKSWVEMKFCPSLADRLRGHKNVVMKYFVDASKLFPSKK